jgi:hypothetical protein
LASPHSTAPPVPLRWGVYLALNLLCCAILLVGGAMAGGAGRAAYVLPLFALCSAPLLFIRQVNDRYALLSVLMGAYFMLFGLADLAAALSRSIANAPSPTISETEWVILLGAIAQLAGFALVSGLAGRDARAASRDWPRAALAPVGLLLWCAGNAATLYESLAVFAGHSNQAFDAGLTQLGSWPALLLFFVSEYAGPLGLVILTYWWCAWQPRGAALLLALLVLAQVAVGWVVDTKEVALAAPLIVILTRTMCVGRLPLRWLVVAAAGVAFIFPIMTAKRIIMTEDLGLTPQAALPRTVELLWRSINEGSAVRSGRYAQVSQTFMERSTLKPNVELIVRNVGKTHPYQMGSTLEPMLSALTPRILWSGRRPENSAQTFNREFQISEDPDTYISLSHLGEWYWNFGVLGVTLGMALAAAAFALVAVRCEPSAGISLTRVLIVIVTLYEVAARAEGQIEVQYVVWLRSLLFIGLLHLLFARPAAGAAAAPAWRGSAPSNVMR